MRSDETLLNQNGAPLRLVVPWKHGFKGIKPIAKIRFVDQQPQNTWRKPRGVAVCRNLRRSY